MNMNFENLNFPSQYLSQSVKEWAKKKNVCEKTVRRDFKQLGLTKTREQYLKDAQTRRETAFKLRKDGLKYKEIANILDITESNAKMLVRRYEI